MANRPIDEKIVAMKMDNSDFVKKATETTKSMGLLTKFLNKIPGVNFGKTTAQLQNIQKSVNGIDTSNLSRAVDTVNSRLSTMGVIGTTALVNITNRAVEAGLAMTKNLTVKPITDGFHEYELEIGSIQTILANTSKFGTTIDDVTKSLAELNTYADKTIFSFSDMTRNIGLFTNAGLGLKESTADIRGFANAAAASGAKADDMSRAAYQLSQGLASGYIMTQDWLSLTNAGMGNDNMKRDLIALGQAMGTLGRSTEDTIQNWKDSLSNDKWLTKEVFSKYLQTMAGDIDKNQLKLIGLSDTQADLLLKNAKIGEESATKVRTFTQMVGTLVESVGSGWTDTWRIIFGGFNDATQLWTGFSEIITKPFNDLTASRNKFVQSLKDNGVFEETFVAIGTAIYVIGQGIGAVTSGFDKAFSTDKIGLVTKMAQGFKSFVSAITPSQKTLDNLSTIFQAIGSNVRVVLKVIDELGKLILKLIPDNLGTNLLDILAKLAKLNISFNDSILNGETFKVVLGKLGDVLSWIGDRIGDVVGSLSKLGDGIVEIWAILASGEAQTNGMFEKDSKVVAWLSAISNATKKIVSDVKDINLSLKPVTDTFNAFFSAISTGFNWLKDKLSGIGQAIKDSMPSGTTLFAGGFIAALTTISILVYKKINDISRGFSGWGKVVKQFAETLDSISGALDSFALNLKANALLTASIAVGVLAGAVLLLSRVNGAEAANSLMAIVGSLTAVIGAMAVMDKYSITGGLKTTTSLIGMGIALSVMAVALKKFGDLKPSELVTGLTGLVVTMGALSGAFVLMGKFIDEKSVLATASQVVAMGSAVLIMALAVKTMGSMDFASLAQGVGAMVVTLGAISGAFILMSKFSGGKTAATATEFVAIAASMIILAGAIKLLSLMDLSSLATGIGSIALILAAVTGFDKLTSGKDLALSAVGLLAMAAGINALLVPIFALGLFPMDKLATGIIGMSVALLALAAATKIMGPGSLVASASIIAMAIGLNMLIIPIAAFAAMGWGPMLIGIAGLGLSLGVLAGVALLLSPAVVPLLAFSAAIGVMGVAMLAAGAGMALFSTGLLSLAGMGAAAVATIVTTIGALIAGFASLIPSAVKFVAQIMTEVFTTIRDKAPEILSLIADTILEVITLTTSYVPKFVAATVKLITSFLDALAEAYPKLIDSAVGLVVSLIKGMADALEKHAPEFTNAFLDVISSILTILVQAGSATIKALLGWIPGVSSAMDKVGATAENAIKGALDAAKVGQDKGDDFAKGLTDKKSDVEDSGKELSKSANDGLVSVNAKPSGEGFISKFISGLLGRKKDVQDASTQLAGAADDSFRERLDIHSPSGEGEDSGESYGDGVANGVDNSTDVVKKSTDNLATTVGSGLGGITEMIRNKLFIKDKDVQDNDKNADKVSESYSKVADEAGNSAKKSSDSQKKSVASTQATLDEAFTKDKQRIDDLKYYKKLSLEDELSEWEAIQARYADGSEERKQADREVFRVQQELEKDGFDKSKQWIDDRKYYQELSLDEELAAWERVQERYLEGTDERKQADREVFRVKQEIAKAEEDLQKKSFDDSKTWIDKSKNYHELSLTDELAAWERVQARFLEGSDERKQADQEVYRVKNEINQKLIALNDEYVQRVQEANKTLADEQKRLDDEYKKSVDDRTKSLTNFVGLFDEVKKPDPDNPITGTKLVENLKGQVNAFATWGDDLRRLAQKGIDQGLLKELEDMGPQAADQVAALNELTTAQLNQYVALWRTKSALARAQANREMEPMLIDNAKNLEQLKNDTAKKLDDYKNEWMQKISEVRVGATEGFVGLDDSMEDIGNNAMKGLIKGLLDQKSPLYDKVKEIASGIGQTIKQTLGINQAPKAVTSIGGIVIDAVNSSKDGMNNAVDSLNNFISATQQPSSNNEIHFKAVLDDSALTGNKFGGTVPVDLSTTNGLVSSTKAEMRQNNNNPQKYDDTKNSASGVKADGISRPLIVQSVLNGRIVAEETVGDISQLMGDQTSLDYVMRGV